MWTLLESLLKSDLMSSADLVNSVAECLQLRLQLGSSWLWKFVDGLGNRDNQLLGANLVSVKKFIMNLQPLEHNSAIDVYHNGDLNAAVRCKELLDKLLTAVANLLQQWPEHPALIQICISVKRLTGLSVKTPLMKLAAAVEDLLRKSLRCTYLFSFEKFNCFLHLS